MVNAKTKGFTVRPAGEGVFFGWDLPEGHSVTDKALMDCSNVELKFNEQTVLVKDVSTDDGQRFTGRIHGFEPAVVVSFEGISIGDEIEFDESYVFGASD